MWLSIFLFSSPWPGHILHQRQALVTNERTEGFPLLLKTEETQIIDITASSDRRMHLTEVHMFDR